VICQRRQKLLPPQAFPDYLLYFLGALFTLTPMFLPKGVMGLFDKLKVRT